jgi:hypothetical protein
MVYQHRHVFHRIVVGLWWTATHRQVHRAAKRRRVQPVLGDVAVARSRDLVPPATSNQTAGVYAQAPMKGGRTSTACFATASSRMRAASVST